MGTNKEVLGVDVSVLGEVEILLSHEHTLAEEVLVDLLAIGLGNEPESKLAYFPGTGEWRGVHCCEFLALFGESHTMQEIWVI